MYNYMSMNPTQIMEGVKQYGPAVGARKMVDWEYQHGQEAIQSGIYITYWCERKKSECGRIGSSSKCFCGHLFKEHQFKFGKKMDTACGTCHCKRFMFVPTRPEECGMFWLPRRKDFKVNEWRAKCKCKHSHEEHSPNRPFSCFACRNCFDFHSDFACISCDQAWEDHEVIYETEDERRMLKKPIREAFLPFSDNKELQNMVFHPTEEQAMKSLAYTRARSTNTNDPAKKPIAASKALPMKVSKGVNVKPKSLALEQEPMIKAQPYGDIDDMGLKIKGMEVQSTSTTNPSTGRLQKAISNNPSKLSTNSQKTNSTKFSGTKSANTNAKPVLSSKATSMSKSKK